MKINLRISELRKLKSISQKKLADLLGVSYQTVSKWENNKCMPDISMLPIISKYFDISVDQLLGLKPINDVEYAPAKTDTCEHWDSKIDYLKKTRKCLLNVDYIEFLVQKVWKIDRAVNIIDFGCGYGFLGQILLPMLPHGSTYSGIDINGTLIDEAKNTFKNTEYKTDFMVKNLYDYESANIYDISICSAFLRHTNKPYEILQKMINSVKLGGKVICFEVNREIEFDGLHIDGLDYDYLCDRNGIRKLWKTELAMQGRDYSIGMKIPAMMNELGLKNIDVRINDRVDFINPNNINYKSCVEDFIISNSIKKNANIYEYENTVNNFLNRGLNRDEAERYCKKEYEISRYIYKNIDNLNIINLRGLLISSADKK